MKNLRAYLEVRESLISFLQQDVGTGDVTSESVLSPDLSACAQIICKSGKSAIIAGLEEAAILFDICKCRVQTLVTDGSRVERWQYSNEYFWQRARYTPSRENRIKSDNENERDCNGNSETC